MSLPASILDRLKTQHESLPLLIANVSKADLEQKPAPGKWSIKDNIAHLAKYQPLHIGRMHRILEHDGITFERYNADLDPDFAEWQLMEINDLLNRISADRKTIIELTTPLPPEQLGRVAIHPKFGKLTVPGWTEFFLLHEAHHLYTIFQLVKR